MGLNLLNFLKKMKLAFSSLYLEMLIFLPDEFSKYRVRYYINKGCKIDRSCSISPNVRIRGRIEMKNGSSIAQNSTLNGGGAGIFIGQNVMIAPNVVVVATSHKYNDIALSMKGQGMDEAAVVIEDDVWICANVTISKGVRVGRGSIIAANSFVNRDVTRYSIVGGVPASLVSTRLKCE